MSGIAATEAIVVAVITAAGSITAAYVGVRARRDMGKVRVENAEQHEASRAQLERLTEAVHNTGGKVDELRSSVGDLADRHDTLAEQFHRHVGEQTHKEP